MYHSLQARNILRHNPNCHIINLHSTNRPAYLSVLFTLVKKQKHNNKPNTKGDQATEMSRHHPYVPSASSPPPALHSTVSDHKRD